MIDRVRITHRPREPQLCQECHVDRNQVRIMLEEHPEREPYDYGFATRLLESENHAQARRIIENCPECKRYFSRKAIKGE